MKKIVCLVLCLIMAVSCFSFSTLAASSNSEKLLADIAACIPEQFKSTHLPQAEKIIRQLDITDEQYAQLKDLIDETEPSINKSYESVHEYSTDTRNYFVDQFKEGLEILDLHYTTELKTNVEHKGDAIATVYDSNGKAIGTLDGDVNPSKTDSSVSPWAWALVAGAVAFAVLGSIVCNRKKKIA